jgi:hypothetical protein
MTAAVDCLRKVMASGLLPPRLIAAVTRGASEEMLQAEECLLGRRLSPSHRALLEAWNGANWDVLRFYCCSESGTRGVSRLAFKQTGPPDSVRGAIAFADDPAGFTYWEDEGGRVFSLDTDGGRVKELAVDLDDFFCRLVFGNDADKFAGQDWKEELQAAGLVELNQLP